MTMQLQSFAREMAQFGRDLAPGTRPHPTGVPGLSLMRALRPGPITHQIHRPLVCLILQGAKEVQVGQARLVARQHDVLVASFDMPGRSRIVTASTEAPYMGLALELDPGLLRRLAARMPEAGTAGPEPDAAAALPERMSVGPALPRMVAALARLFELRGEPQALAALQPLIVEEIHYWLLGGPQGAALRAIARPGGHGERIARAVAMIRADPAAALAVPALARAAGMSASAFHQHFKALTSVTPLQFQKHLRLVEAQALLQAGESVAQAAFAVGYESPTQFSREFARMFGHPPMRELTLARTG